MYISSVNPVQKAYTPGYRRNSLYKGIWSRHWPVFRALYGNCFARRFGELKEEKISEVKKLLDCGDFKNGYRKHACENCGTVFIVPFTCKSRLCLSCYRKRLYGWSIHLSQIMITTLNHSWKRNVGGPHLLGPGRSGDEEALEHAHSSYPLLQAEGKWAVRASGAHGKIIDKFFLMRMFL